jgi:hypothetical protein
MPDVLLYDLNAAPTRRTRPFSPVKSRFTAVVFNSKRWKEKFNGKGTVSTMT